MHTNDGFIKYIKIPITSWHKNNAISFFNITTYKLLYYGLGIQMYQITENSEEEKTVRIITLSGYSKHSEPLFKQLNMLNIAEQLRLQELKFDFKYIH